nr:threonine/serine exporter family protein [Clostridium niameyense]
MTVIEYDMFQEYVLEIGRRMVMCGTEVRRVEDTIIRICRAYGIKVCEIHATITLIVMTIKDSKGRHYTQSVRIKSTATDLGQLEALNAMAREICSTVPPISEIKSALDNNKLRTDSDIAKFVGYMCAAGGFAVFFGGTWKDGIVSSIIATAIFFMDKFSKIRKLNKVIYTVISCFISGCLAELSNYMNLCIKLDKVMIGDIMIFIPALILVNGIREMFYQDIISGLYRLIEALMIAIAIAVGFGSSMILLGGVS